MAGAILPGFPYPTFLNETVTQQAILPGVFINETSSAGTSLTPTVGSVVFTGYVPVVTVGTTVAPGTGSIVATGYAPVISGAISLAPGSGSVVFTGFAPTVTAGTVLTPAAGSIVATGQGPFVNQSLLPAAGSIIATGHAPVVAVGTTVAPGAGSILATGFAPAVTWGVTVAPGAGSIVTTGFAPTISNAAGVAWNPADKDAAITLSVGNTIATTNATSQTGVRSITSNTTGKYYAELTLESTPGNGFVGGIATAGWSLTSIMGADTTSVGIGFFGGDVHLNGALLGNAGGGAVSGSVFSIAVDLTNSLIWIRLNNGNWNANGAANPATGTGGWSLSTLAAGAVYCAMGDINTTGASLLFTGAAPFAYTPPSTFAAWNGSTAVNVSPSQGSIVATGFAPSANQSLLPAGGSIIATGYAPSLLETLLPGVGNLTFTGFAPVASGSLPAFTPAAGAIAITGFAPSVIAAITLAPGSGSIVATGIAPNVSNLGPGAISAAPGAGSIVATGHAPGLSVVGVFIAPGPGSLTFTGLPPSISLGPIPPGQEGNWTVIGSGPPLGIWTVYQAGPNPPAWVKG